MLAKEIPNHKLRLPEDFTVVENIPESPILFNIP